MKARNRILAFMVYLNDVTEGGETALITWLKYDGCKAVANSILGLMPPSSDINIQDRFGNTALMH